MALRALDDVYQDRIRTIETDLQQALHEADRAFRHPRQSLNNEYKYRYSRNHQKEDKGDALPRQVQHPVFSERRESIIVADQQIPGNLERLSHKSTIPRNSTATFRRNSIDRVLESRPEYVPVGYPQAESILRHETHLGKRNDVNGKIYHDIAPGSKYEELSNRLPNITSTAVGSERRLSQIPVGRIQTGLTVETVERSEFDKCLEKIAIYIHSEECNVEYVFPYLRALRKRGRFQRLSSMPNCPKCGDFSETVPKKLEPLHEIPLSDRPQRILEREDSITLRESWSSICHHVASWVRKRLTTSPRFIHFDRAHLIEVYRCVKTQLYLDAVTTCFDASFVSDYHRRIRETQLKTLICVHVDGSHGTSCLKCLTQLSLHCLAEDCSLALSRVFRPSNPTLADLKQPYEEHLRTITDQILADYQNILAHEQKTNEKLSLERFKPVELAVQLVKRLHYFEERSGILSCLDTVTETTKRFGSAIIIGQRFSKGDAIHPALMGCSIHKSLLTSTEKDCDTPFSLIYDWRRSITESGVMSELQQGLESAVHLALSQCLADLDAGNFVAVSKSLDKYETRPLLVLKSVANITDTIKMFGCVCAASQGAMRPFQSSFAHVLHTTVKPLVDRLLGVRRHTQWKGLTNLYTLYNSACLLQVEMDGLKSMRGWCTHHQNGLNSLVSQTIHLQETLQRTIFAYHMRFIEGILHKEAATVNRAKRPSEATSSWCLYATSLRVDLLEWLQPSQARRLLAEIVTQSLSLFIDNQQASNYHTHGLCEDIEAMLRCVGTWLLPAVCLSPGELYNMAVPEKVTDPRLDAISSIHRQCTQLLAIWFVLTSTPSELYGVLGQGYRPKISAPNDSPDACWLHYIESPGQGVVEGTMPSTAITLKFLWHHVAMCRVQPAPLQPLVTRTVLTESGTLSSLLLCRITDALTEKKPKKSVLKNTDHGSNNNNNNNQEPAKKRVEIVLPGQTNDDEGKVIQLTDALLSVLIHSCGSRDDSIANLIVPVIQRTNGWQALDVSQLTAITNRPWWLKAIQKLLHDYVKNVACHIANEILTRRYTSDNSPEQWRHIEWSMHSSIKNPHSQVEAQLSDLRCVSKLLEATTERLITLPPPLLNFLSSLDTHLPNIGVQPILSNAGLQILLCTLYDYLRYETTRGELFGISEEAKRCLPVAEELATVLFGISKLPVVEEELEPLKKHLMAARKVLDDNKLFLENYQNRSVTAVKKQVSNAELSVQANAIITAQHLMEHSNGSEKLALLHWAFVTNWRWFQWRLRMNPDASREPKIELDLKPTYPPMFRPFEALALTFSANTGNTQTERYRFIERYLCSVLSEDQFKMLLKLHPQMSPLALHLQPDGNLQTKELEEQRRQHIRALASMYNIVPPTSSIN